MTPHLSSFVRSFLNNKSSETVEEESREEMSNQIKKGHICSLGLVLSKQGSAAKPLHYNVWMLQALVIWSPYQSQGRPKEKSENPQPSQHSDWSSVSTRGRGSRQARNQGPMWELIGEGWRQGYQVSQCIYILDLSCLIFRMWWTGQLKAFVTQIFCKGILNRNKTTCEKTLISSKGWFGWHGL